MTLLLRSLRIGSSTWMAIVFETSDAPVILMWGVFFVAVLSFGVLASMPIPLEAMLPPSIVSVSLALRSTPTPV
jgi:hypothetical protein